jgi:hypothetical protein
LWRYQALGHRKIKNRPGERDPSRAKEA